LKEKGQKNWRKPRKKSKFKSCAHFRVKERKGNKGKRYIEEEDRKNGQKKDAYGKKKDWACGPYQCLHSLKENEEGKGAEVALGRGGGRQ